LQQAAQQLKQTTQGRQPNPNNPVPGEAASQVSEAMQQLADSGEALENIGPLEGVPGDPMGEGQSQAQSPMGQAMQSQPGQQPGQNQPGEGQPGSGNPQPAGSESLKNAAQAMRQAAKQMGLDQKSQSQGQMAQGQPGGDPGDGQSGDEGGVDDTSLVDPDNALNGKTRNWGKLPGTLKTELLESARRTTDGDYAKPTRKYFQDISRARPPEVIPDPAE
jgi:hypothetical protein